MIPTTRGSFLERKFFREIHAFRILSREDEQELSRRWHNQADVAAANKIVTAHLRLVTKIAMTYRGYGLPVGDLVSEGSLGLMRAVRHFDPERGIRFATYARWWVRAAIQDHILHCWSPVKLGTTAAEKKLFFNLCRLKSQMHILDDDDLLPDQVASIAHKLAVSERDVIQMNRRLHVPVVSINMPIREDGDDEWQDNLPDETVGPEDAVADRDELSTRAALLPCALSTLSVRERHILTERRLKDAPTTLEELARHYQLSRERIRQIEVRAFKKLRESVRTQFDWDNQDRCCVGGTGHMPDGSSNDRRQVPALESPLGRQ